MDNKQLAEAYLADKTIERTHRYLVDGREYADLSDDELIEYWVWMFRELAVTAFTQDHFWASLADLESELSLRGIEKPKEQVRPELALLAEHIERRWREHRLDPSGCAKAQAELAEFRERLSQPKH